MMRASWARHPSTRRRASSTNAAASRFRRSAVLSNGGTGRRCGRLWHRIFACWGRLTYTKYASPSPSHESSAPQPPSLDVYKRQVLIGVLVTRAGLRNGVERITKVMMIALFAVLAVLVVRAVTLPGAQEGLAFYLMPDFGKLFAGGWGTFADAVFAAMGQAFFTVSVGCLLYTSRCV